MTIVIDPNSFIDRKSLIPYYKVCRELAAQIDKCFHLFRFHEAIISEAIYWYQKSDSRLLLTTTSENLSRSLIEANLDPIY